MRKSLPTGALAFNPRALDDGSAMLSTLLFLAAQTPDVLIVVLDDVAAADLALYGGPAATPHLAALAAEGVTFTRAYANATCSPTRRSILTGEWATGESGVPCGPPTADTPGLDALFIPEALPAHAAGLFGKWHLGGDPLKVAWELAPLRHGFSFWLAGQAANVNTCDGGSNYTRWIRADAFGASWASGLSLQYEPKAVRDEFLTWWPAARGPRFAYVATNLAHGPFHAPPADLLPPGAPVAVLRRDRYEAMIRAADTILGQMLLEIDLERTLVVVVSDNGTPEQVTPEPGRSKTTTFERGIRVPLVIAGAGVEKGLVSDALVHAVDIYGTVLAACGAKIPAASPAEDLGPILRGKGGPVRSMAICGHGWGFVAGGNVAAVSTSRKLIWWDDDGDGAMDRELYFDLALDPGEIVNLIDDPARQCELGPFRAALAAELL